MPANLPAEWFTIENEYRREKNLEKKIELMKKLISSTPKHKGTENLLADLKKKLSKLEEELEKKSRKLKRRQETIKKTGDILVAIVGLTKSGKSSLINALTNASVEVSDKPYTTKEPVTGVCLFEGVAIQLVEIPSFFLRKHMSIVHSEMARRRLEGLSLIKKIELEVLEWDWLGCGIAMVWLRGQA